MSPKNLRIGPSSFSTTSLSSLSDLALRNRTVSRDSLSSFGDSDALALSSDSSSNPPDKRKKKREKPRPLRKTKKTKRSIGSKPKLKLKDTMVLVPFHALKETFQKQLKRVCCQNIDFISEDVGQKSFKKNFKKKNSNRKKFNTSEETAYCNCFDNDNSINSNNKEFTCTFQQGKHANNSESSSINLENFKRLTTKSKAKRPSAWKNKRNNHLRRKIKTKNARSKFEPEPYLHKKITKNVSRKKRKNEILGKDPKKTYNTRFRARLVENNRNFIDISLDNDLENQAEKPEILNDDKSMENDMSKADPSEPPCIVLHPYDPARRKNEKNLSDDSDEDSDSAPDAIKPENFSEKKQDQEKNDGAAEESTSKNTNLSRDKLEKDGKTVNAVEPCVIVQEHFNAPSSADLSITDDEQEQASYFYRNQMEETTGLTCGLQESNLPMANYVFGQRNDFSRLREFCEYSFGLPSTTENDERNEVGDFFTRRT